MRIYILRHGAAEPNSSIGDQGRRLIPEGKEKIRGVARFIRGKINPSLILSSPYIRAVETARIFGQEIGYTGKIEETPLLTPEYAIEKTIIGLKSFENNEILLVGHNPHLSELTAGIVSDGSLHFAMKKAALAGVEFKDSIRQGSGFLLWIVTAGLCE